MEGLEGPIIIAIVSIGGIIATLLVNIRSQNALTKAQFATILNNYIQEHSKFLKEESKLKTVFDCQVHAISYFDLMDRIAYLCLNKKIPSEIGDYFKEYFSYVQLMMKWYDDTVAWESGVYSKKRWTNIVSWCKEKNIDSDENLYFLPNIMNFIYKLFNEQKEFPELTSKYNSLSSKKSKNSQEGKEITEIAKKILKITDDVNERVEATKRLEFY